MSLVLHHLQSEDKVRALSAARRLLEPGGEPHVVDWIEGRTVAMRAAFVSSRLLDGFANTRDMRAACFDVASKRHVSRTWRRPGVSGQPTESWDSSAPVKTVA